MLTVDIALPEVEELQKLVQHGQEKGFLTYDEIVAGLEEVDLTKEQIEDGSMRAMRPALAEFLRRLGLETGELGVEPVVNSRGELVGEVVLER